MITKDEAQNVAETFLQEKYFNSKIHIRENQLVTKTDAQVYQLNGEMSMQSHGVFDRFIIDKTANKYLFKIEIDAQQGHILNYELT